MRSGVNRRDLLFVIETLMPARDDKEHVADVIQGDDSLVQAMLDDDRLFARLTGDEEAALQLSPWLFFTVLLRRAGRDLERESFTVELRGRQRVFLFDVKRVVELLQDAAVRDYLAILLASFVRVESATVRVRVRPGIWHRYRVSELDVESMLRYAGTLDHDSRFPVYRRIGDVCLFLAGIFPEHIHGLRRSGSGGQLRPPARGRLLTTLEDYEAQGQALYRLASEHELAREHGLDDVLGRLSEDFVLAEKALNFVATRYLQLARYRWFPM
jgi:hypothetical protein